MRANLIVVSLIRMKQDRKSTRLKLQSQSNLVCRLLLEKKKLNLVACVASPESRVANQHPVDGALPQAPCERHNPRAFAHPLLLDLRRSPNSSHATRL